MIVLLLGGSGFAGGAVLRACVAAPPVSAARAVTSSPTGRTRSGWLEE
jgi:uncharacterized protein YbjT (DUF2867 family)